ncbi:CGNR zinc finger domain-containing protein [Microbacterium sp. NPDC089696]|uniref:CGNR zinc finger domain-containing protein n=1 Tax=Microbacterium sp. NPDC089696 TaxID=3364199 RepID=UPI00382377A9
MLFAHDNMPGVHLSAALVNAAVSEVARPALEALLDEHGIRRPQLDVEQAALLHDWAVRLRAVFAAEDVDARTVAVNALLTVGTTGVYLTTHDGRRPHLHFTPEDDDVVGRVRAVTAGGLAIFTVESEGERLGACLRAGCRAVFVDTSRNGRRRYCSARCGNYDAVHRHRSRT